ncbi:hypothetical protein [Dyadobacter jejuensis]|nr:hypothetical protein [Dyadobacter jejuensis]
MKRYWGFPSGLFVFMMMLWGQPAYSSTPSGPLDKGIPTIREFQITENDTLSYTLKLAFDESGRPQYFYRNIFTPVCYTNECKPVYINFYWDLLGNYQRFDLPKGKILTKVDHDPFMEEDYQKLQEILSKENSIFIDLEMNDLIVEGTDDLSDSVDTKSGATLKTIKNEIIDGAVYTCFTLWKIAHGKIAEVIPGLIHEYEDDMLIHEFLRSSNHHYQNWALDRLFDSQGKVRDTFSEDLMGVMSGKNIFTAKQAWTRVNPSFFENPNRQQWLVRSFDSVPYSTQLVILDKLPKIRFQDGVLARWIDRLPSSNREQREGLVEMLKAQDLSSRSQQQLLAFLDRNDAALTQSCLAVLEQVEHPDPRIIQKLKEY